MVSDRGLPDRPFTDGERLFCGAEWGSDIPQIKLQHLPIPHHRRGDAGVGRRNQIHNLIGAETGAFRAVNQSPLGGFSLGKGGRSGAVWDDGGNALRKRVGAAVLVPKFRVDEAGHGVCASEEENQWEEVF